MGSATQPHKRPTSLPKRHRFQALAASESKADICRPTAAIDGRQGVREQVLQLRTALAEAQQQLREVSAQMAEAVGQRDAVTVQAEAAARDATNLLQLMARRTAAQSSSHGAEAKADADSGANDPVLQRHASERGQVSISRPEAANEETGPSPADVKRLEQQLQVPITWPCHVKSYRNTLSSQTIPDSRARF